MKTVAPDIAFQIASQCSLPLTFSEAIEFFTQTSSGSALLVAHNIEDYKYLGYIKDKDSYSDYSFFIAPSGYVFEIEKNNEFSSLELAILHLRLGDIKLESSLKILSDNNVDEEFVNDFIAAVGREKYKFSPLYFNKTAKQILDEKLKQKALEKVKGRH